MPPPNVQFMIKLRNGKLKILWRYCRTWQEANELCGKLKIAYHAQKVWF